MGNGVKKSGFQTLALPLGFGLPELLDGARALDRNSNQRAQSLDGLTRELCAGDSEAGNGTDAEAHRDEILGMLGVESLFVIQEGQPHLFFIKVGGAEAGTVEFVFLWQEKLSRASLKALHNIVGNGVHQLDDVPFTQQLPAESVQTLHFPPAMMRFIGLFANTRRKAAPGNRSD